MVTNVRRGLSSAWGVSNSPATRWGWVKAVDHGECPEDVNYWRVFQRTSNSWVLDTSLTVTCTSVL